MREGGLVAAFSCFGPSARIEIVNWWDETARIWAIERVRQAGET